MAQSIIERLAVAEEKLKRLDKLEKDLELCKTALLKVAKIADENFFKLSRNSPHKSSGFFSDFF